MPSKSSENLWFDKAKTELREQNLFIVLNSDISLKQVIICTFNLSFFCYLRNIWNWLKSFSEVLFSHSGQLFRDQELLPLLWKSWRIHDLKFFFLFYQLVYVFLCLKTSNFGFLWCLIEVRHIFQERLRRCI